MILIIRCQDLILASLTPNLRPQSRTWNPQVPQRRNKVTIHPITFPEPLSEGQVDHLGWRHHLGRGLLVANGLREAEGWIPPPSLAHISAFPMEAPEMPPRSSIGI